MLLRIFITLTAFALLTACGGGGSYKPSSNGSSSSTGGGKYYKDDGPPADYRDNHIKADAVPKVEPKSRGGNPKSYVIFGKRYYVMQDSKGYVDRGIASWYGKKFHGRKTSNGETYDMYAMTAAHKTLPIPTYVEVENLKTGKTIVVRVNDRGPFHEGRIIDLSYAAAQKLGTAAGGTGLVEVRAIDPRTWQSDRTTQPTAKPAPQPKPVTPQSNTQIYLQLGAFSVRHNAEKFMNEVISKAFSGVLVSEGRNSSGLSVFRVRIGPLATVELADNIISRLIQHGYDEFHIVIE